MKKVTLTPSKPSRVKALSTILGILVIAEIVLNIDVFSLDNGFLFSKNTSCWKREVFFI